MADEEGRQDVVTDVEQTGWLARLGRSVGGAVAFGAIWLARQRKERKTAIV